jgi:alpha-amylase
VGALLACGESAVPPSAPSLSVTAFAAPAYDVNVQPTTASLTVGQQQQFTATVTSNGSTIDVTVRWTVSNMRVANITDQGLLVAIRPGETDVIARYRNATGTAHVTVSAAP